VCDFAGGNAYCVDPPGRDAQFTLVKVNTEVRPVDE
jgi:hypothetical protein